MGKAAQHKAMVLAQMAAKERGEDEAETMEGATPYDQELMRLRGHLQELKAIQSTERKIARKAEILPEYDAYIDGVMEADSGVQDDVFMTVLVWAIDAHEFDQALEMVRFALDHEMALPERFDRSLQALAVEEISDAVLKQEADLTLERAKELDDLTIGLDMHDQIRAKLYRVIGQLHQAKEHDEEAINAYERALKLDEGVGVKSTLKKLVKKIEDGQKQQNK